MPGTSGSGGGGGGEAGKAGSQSTAAGPAGATSNSDQTAGGTGAGAGAPAAGTSSGGAGTSTGTTGQRSRTACINCEFETNDELARAKNNAATANRVASTRSFGSGARGSTTRHAARSGRVIKRTVINKIPMLLSALRSLTGVSSPFFRTLPIPSLSASSFGLPDLNLGLIDLIYLRQIRTCAEQAERPSKSAMDHPGSRVGVASCAL
jgi:hypothetical protein